MNTKLGAFILLMSLSSLSISDEKYFYCGYSNLDGSEQDYSKWGKNTDFTFNKNNNRWEWISKVSSQYIYPDGRYEEIARVAYLSNKRGQCNSKMERIYNQKMEEIRKKYGS